MEGTRLQRRYWTSLLLLPLLVGCHDAPDDFTPDRLNMVAAGLVPEHQTQVSATVERLFGTPAEPLIPEGSDLDLELLTQAAGAVRSVKPGEVQGLYRQHCALCHGVTGDGLGPAAAMLDPYPRDFRLGTFKWKQTYRREAPTRDDLRAVLENGVPGTAMPSFTVLDERQRDALVEYVVYLSQRGQVERQLIAAVADELDYDPQAGTTGEPFEPENSDDHAALVDEALSVVNDRWHRASAQKVAIPSLIEQAGQRDSRAISASTLGGEELFRTPRANCAHCHGIAADGVGSLVDYDDWGKPVADFVDATNRLAARLDGEASDDGSGERLREHLTQRRRIIRDQLTPRAAEARDLAHRSLRGGNSLQAVYLRVHQGIAGTPMPAHGPAASGIAGTLADDEMLRLVDYVRSLHPSR